MRVALFFIFTLFVNCVVAKPIEITFWHSLAGLPGQELNKLITNFNNSQKNYIIRHVYKGPYIDTITSFAAAFRAGKPPAMVQIFEVGSPIMSIPKGIIKPIDEIINNEEMTIDYDGFYPAILNYYSSSGHLLAMPFNVSMPVMFYNKDVLKTLGFKDNFPKTWQEFESLLIKIKQAGFSCSYTSAYPAWIMIESFSATQGLPLIDTVNNKVLYNNSKVLNHLNRLVRWQKEHYFKYGGRNDDATSLFTSSTCPVFSQSSGAYFGLQSLLPFELGIAPIPHENNNKKYNNTIGGAAIWVVANQEEEIYKGIAKFLVYLNEPKIQDKWYKSTGYLPINKKRYDNKKSLNENFLITLANKELNNNKLIQNGSIVMHSKIREINDEMLEAIFSNIKTPVDGLNEAEKRANNVLLRFNRNTNKVK